jgi:hypothetical protein
MPGERGADSFRVAATAREADIGLGVLESHHYLPLDVVGTIIVPIGSEDDPPASREQKKRC